ncbi:hypothetical protein P3X46_031148 [Hevea brasiliensis]|uniref:Uncharacterized protein n=1 Tax=Hevea brasiliensis TaxID=3981 RepID=A0ABQ9KL87_HEVBR|nr:hypothetical protein P3X46_031148 [Hevea brasiliensis]
MADLRGVNIMSVEAAVQKELAHRRKVAILEFLTTPSSDPSPNTMPRSNSGSTHRHSGIKRNAVTSSIEFLTAPQPQELQNRMDLFLQVLPSTLFLLFLLQAAQKR